MRTLKINEAVRYYMSNHPHLNHLHYIIYVSDVNMY